MELQTYELAKKKLFNAMKVIRHEFFVRINRTVHSVSKSLVFINIGAAVQLWEAKFDSSRMRSHSAVTSSHNKFQVRFLTTTCSVLTGKASV